MTGLFTIDSLIALLTLSSLEIVLGIDNIVLIVLLTGRLEPSLQPLARRLGLILAMSTRILLLIFLNWMAHLTDPLFAILSHPVSGRDLILCAGEFFLSLRPPWKFTNVSRLPKALPRIFLHREHSDLSLFR